MRRLLVGLLGAAGCSEAGDAGTTTMVIDPDGWEVLDGAADPFAAERPGEAACDPSAVTQEVFGGEPALEVWTGLCDWVSVTQPLLAAVPAGAEVTLRLWHFELTAPAPGSARLAVAIDGEPVWQTTLVIPAASGLVRETWTLPRAAAAGAPIVFHLDNHGANTYALLEISAIY
jgi:hypothetical protein